MIPTYSEAAKAAIPSLTNTAYKAFIFFEDENSENFYEEIAKKITTHHKSVRIVCLKGKDSLIEHCLDIDNSKTKNKTIYVLDKDFDDLTGTKVIDDSIHYLEKYSIENYLLEINAVSRIVLEEKPKTNRTTGTGDIANTHLIHQSASFFRLSSLFLINEIYSLGIKSCSEPIQKFSLDKKPWQLCEDKIDAYAEEISIALILNGYADSEEDLSEILTRNEAKISNLCHTPGKHILDNVRFYLNHKYEIRIPSRESFAFRLASLCSLESLNALRSKLDSILLIHQLEG